MKKMDGTNIEDCEIQERIKRLRENRRLSQAELAQIFNVSEDLIKKMENGSRNVTLDHVRSYHDFFHVSFDYLIYGKQERRPMERMLEEIGSLSPDEKKELVKYIIDIL